MVSLLGEDGLGYDLARKLEQHGIWKQWLGEPYYISFRHSLSSQATWEAFMIRGDDGSKKSKEDICVQLRVRALLVDKAMSVNKEEVDQWGSTEVAVSKLNPSYLQLRGDDVFYSLEDLNPMQQSNSKTQVKPPSLKHAEPKFGNDCEMIGIDGFPESWYKQFIDKYKASKTFPLCEREPQERTPEGMATYIRLTELHKRKRQPFVEDQYMGLGNSRWENGLKGHQNTVSYGSSSGDDESFFLPEMMFRSNCVPDTALLPSTALDDNNKIEFYGVLDRLPPIMNQSTKRGSGLEGNVKIAGQEQALAMSRKVIARILSDVGFDSAKGIPMEALSQFMCSHILKLSRNLKVLTDNYRKQFSALQIIRMFLQTLEHSDLETLIGYVKDGTRKSSYIQEQQVRGLETDIQSQHHNSNLQTQQIPRAVQSHVQLAHPQNLVLQLQQHQHQHQQLQQQHQQMQQYQQQQQQQQQQPQPQLQQQRQLHPQRQQQEWEMMQRKFVSINPPPVMQVKIENMTDIPMEGNVLAPINRQSQMQSRQQQVAATMANLHSQSSQQFRQVSPLQTQNSGAVRAPPVKVEGFQDLMGGNATMKHDSEEQKLTSPSQ